MYLRHGELLSLSSQIGEVAVARTAASAPQDAAKMPIIELEGVRLHAITESQLISHILTELAAGRGGWVVTPNLDYLRRCRNDPEFKKLVARADLAVADGMPVVWASRIQGMRLPQRVAGSDVISSLSDAAAARGRSVFLLGGDPGTAEAASDILKQRSPGLKIVGTFCPPLGFERDEKMIREIADKLAAATPDIIYVALGSPKQELLISRLRDELPQSWWLGVGVSFSFLCGQVRRAPIWMRKTGLEWIHRLVQEPRRLFKRYIVVGLPYAAEMFTRAAIQRVFHPSRATPNASPPRRIKELGEPSVNAPLASPAIMSAGLISSGLAASEWDVTTPISSASEVVQDKQFMSIVMEDRKMPQLPALQQLRGLILLAGSVRPTPLASSIGRSLLDLPVDDKRSILNLWLEQAARVAEMIGIEKLPVRVMVNGTTPEPKSALPKYSGTLSIEWDISEYRGTGGLLASLSEDYEDDDLILVANAGQVLLDDLGGLVSALREAGGVVNLISHQDGTPSGIMLMTCGALRLIPKIGYVDMKEQALPAIAARHEVRVVHRRRPTGLAVRTTAEYIQALRCYHRGGTDNRTVDPLAEDWTPAFSIIETGAKVDPSARVHDSVVLAGGVVEAQAVLVRCVVAPDGIIKRDRKAVDQCLTARTNGQASGSKLRGSK